METKDILKKLDEFTESLNTLNTALDIDGKKNRINELDSIMSDPNFWSGDDTTSIISESKNLRGIVDSYNDIKDNVNTLKEMCSLDLSEEDINGISSEIEKIEHDLDELNLSTFLSGEFDSEPAYIEIHSGAGGTESNDWANMILRMYTRFFEKNDYKYEVISKSEGEEVGIKGCVLLVKGYYPFGYLKGETGVHRLVRISPFDSNARRHTSFASVLVTPQINKNIEVDIKESDLKIDVFHSGGAGGQSVNTSDSAVRITHLPTGIVVSCQVERSQLLNKERCMEMLKTKLYIMQEQEFKDKVKELKGDVMDVNFGSAIRSYVMCPYTMVKDTRTNYETSNVEKVLDGDIEGFLEAYLKTTK